MNQSPPAAGQSGAEAGVAAFSSILVPSALFTEDLSVRAFSILLGM